MKPTEKKDFDWRFRYLEPTKNKPEINFRLHLDKNTKNSIDAIKSASEIAFDLKKYLSNNLSEIKKKIPATIKDESRFLRSRPWYWSDVRRFSSNMASKHGIRFLLVTWYDGEEYKQKINSAIKQLDKLQRNHEDEVQFLDEVNRRCYYALQEYYFETDAILEEIMKKNFFEISNPFELIEDAFWFKFREDIDLVRLEVCLVSENVSRKLKKEFLTREPPTAGEKIVSPYDLIIFGKYAKMKVPFLGVNEKKGIINDLLTSYSKFLEEEGVHYSSDFRKEPERYRSAIDSLLRKLEMGKNEPASKEQPILNFKFFSKSIENFLDAPLVTNFLRFKTS